MDQYRIDSHKLMYHVPRVNEWLQGKIIYPIYMEISPIGACNHRCTFCALDFMGYENRKLNPAILAERLSEMGRLGVKSIMLAGEGEPFLYKEIASIIHAAKRAGIDVAVTTNGVLFNQDLMESTLPDLTWIKVSINAGTKSTYAAIHRTRESDFDNVIDHISNAARFKKKHNLTCAIGMQMVLLPENGAEALSLAKISREAGADYLVIKPYSQHTKSKTDQYRDVKYQEFLNLEKELERVNTDSFHVVFRRATMEKWDRGERGYDRCLALPFWSYIDAGGNVWGCSAHLLDDRFNYGNINIHTFEEIWNSEKRKNSLKEMAESFDTEACRVNCRMDEVNRYLWDLKHPSGHVNFI